MITTIIEKVARTAPVIRSIEVCTEGYNAFPRTQKFPNLTEDHELSYCNKLEWCCISATRLAVNSILSFIIGDNSRMSLADVASLMQYESFDPAVIGSREKPFLWITRKGHEKKPKLHAKSIGHCNLSPDKEDDVIELFVPAYWVRWVTYSAERGWIEIKPTTRSEIVLGMPWNGGEGVSLLAKTLQPLSEVEEVWEVKS